MNCRRFQDELLEHVEGTLSAGAQALAEQHLAGCIACRQAVEKEKRLARAMSSRLRQSSETLTLHPNIRRNILAASRRKTALPAPAEPFARLWRSWLRLAVVPASLLVVAACLLAIHFSGVPRHETISVPTSPRISAPAPALANNPQPAVSVQLSWRLPVRRFYQEGNMAVDTLIDETVVASGTFHPGGQESVSPQLEMKTPL